MSDLQKSNKSEIEKLNEKISSVETRLQSIEAKLDILSDSEPLTDQKLKETEKMQAFVSTEPDSDSFLETRIGEYGLAWIGSIVLLFGITFLTGYLQSIGIIGTSALIGYACVIIILFLSDRIRKSFPHMGYVLNLNGHILLYYITLRLHFFSENILLQNKTIALILLLVIVIFQVYIAVKTKSQSLFSLALTLTLLTAIVSDTTHFMLPVLTVASITATWFMFRFTWKSSLIYSIFLVYTGFLLWFLNNPVMGNQFGAIEAHNFGVIYIFAVGGIYSLVALAREKNNISEDYAVWVIVLNGMSFTFLLALSVIQFYSENYISLFITITLYCLVYSVILKTFSEWKFTSASYSLYGFVAMSVALYGLFGLPDVFLLLTVQSLIVVSFALWFRNKIIIIMNTLLLISLLIIYLASSDPVNGVNFFFAIVAILTARILNWKRERLEIKTDMLRNINLILGFFLVLYALFHWAPKQYITLSWSAAALMYFVLSILLKNVKYRHMALGTIIATAFYLFIVDLAEIEIFYRILALMFLAFVSIGISIFYAKNKKKLNDS